MDAHQAGYLLSIGPVHAELEEAECVTPYCIRNSMAPSQKVPYYLSIPAPTTRCPSMYIWRIFRRVGGYITPPGYSHY